MRNVLPTAIGGLTALILLGVAVMPLPQANGACDSKCRERRLFYICPGGSSAGKTIVYARAVCELCSSQVVLGGLCAENTSDTKTDKTCGTSGFVSRDYYDMPSTLNCSCGTGIVYVEASYTQIPIVTTSVTRYICDP